MHVLVTVYYVLVMMSAQEMETILTNEHIVQNLHTGYELKAMCSGTYGDLSFFTANHLIMFLRLDPDNYYIDERMRTFGSKQTGELTSSTSESSNHNKS